MTDSSLEEETVWITEDDVFDLLFMLCDMLHHDGYVRSSYRVEQLIDEFLDETGRARLSETQPKGIAASEASASTKKIRAAALMFRAKEHSNSVSSTRNIKKRLVG